MNMNNHKIEQILQRAGVRPSPVRILVVRELDAVGRPVSGQDIEDALQTVDRSSITRTLALFVNCKLVHSVDDGSGSVKYELCRSENSDEHDLDEHPHFHCVNCGTTYCLDAVSVPSVMLPAGFIRQSVNYVIKGLCPKCCGCEST